MVARTGIAAAGRADRLEWGRRMIAEAGAELVDPAAAEGLVWVGGPGSELRLVLGSAPGIRWVQLPTAGVEAYDDLLSDGRTWACAKGVYAPQVAEHALALALAGTRRLKQRLGARSWSEDDGGQSLLGARVVLLGGGGIASALLSLLAPFGCRSTVVRKHPAPVPGAAEVVGSGSLHSVLPDADLVVVALALTAETEGVIGAPELDLMKDGAWLVNVARGRHVRTDELVAGLREGRIGAGLDVTDPEPLPDRHPLWALPNCLITPHCANPGNLSALVLAERVKDNIRRSVAGRPLEGVVNVELGY